MRRWNKNKLFKRIGSDILPVYEVRMKIKFIFNTKLEVP